MLGEMGVVIMGVLVVGGEDGGVVEGVGLGDKVGFGDDGGVVGGLVEEFGECVVVGVEGGWIMGKGVLVGEVRGKEGGG